MNGLPAGGLRALHIAPQVIHKEGGSVDQVLLFAGITRYHKLIERTDYLASVLNQSARHLLSGTPGPVVLSIPFNVQKELVDDAILEQVAFTRLDSDPVMPPQYIDQSLALIREARRPLIIAGYGCLLAGARTPPVSNRTSPPKRR